MTRPTSAEYRAYMRSPEWAAVRARFIAGRTKKQCEGCGARDRLHVHHATYKRFGAERLTDLRLVCQACHTAIHAFADAQKYPDLWRATRKSLQASRARHGYAHKANQERRVKRAA
jgi:predicted HNH restriction endonuclease